MIGLGMVSYLGRGTTETVWTPATLPAFGSASGSWTNNTLRQRIEASLIPVNGSQVRFSIRGGGISSEGFSINKCYIGIRGSGAYDFATTPTQVFWSGSASTIIPSATTRFCDPVTLAITTSDDVIISVFCPTGASANDTFEIGGSNSVSPYDSVYKAGDDATTLVATGYSNWSGYTYVCALDDFEIGN